MRRYTLTLFFVALASCTTGSDPSPSTTAADGHDHDHSTMMAVEWDGDGTPEVAVTIEGDNSVGWTVGASFTNFVLSGTEALEHVPGEGHAHLWIDGDVYSMMFGATTAIAELSPGSHDIMVTLSTNDHLEYVLEGEPIVGRASVVVPGAVETADLSIRLTIVDGEATWDPESPQVAIGGIVEIVVVSDTSDQVHVHGYDVLGILTPGQETRVRFTADIPGVFEVELEESGLALFSIRTG